MDSSAMSAALEELGERFPRFPQSGFRAAVSYYCEIRDYPQPPAAPVRDELDGLEQKADELIALLSSISRQANDALAIRDIRHGGAGLVGRMKSDLRHLAGISEMARRDAERLAVAGSPVQPRTKLVSLIAAILEEQQMDISAKPQGSLVRIFAIAVEAAGETVADPRRSVSAALERIKRKQRSL